MKIHEASKDITRRRNSITTRKTSSKEENTKKTKKRAKTCKKHGPKDPGAGAMSARARCMRNCRCVVYSSSNSFCWLPTEKM